MIIPFNIKENKDITNFLLINHKDTYIGIKKIHVI